MSSTYKTPLSRNSFLNNQLVFAGKIGILIQATSDDDSPIPGYLYTEINEITFLSQGCCQNLLEFLVQRLEKRSLQIKLKTLKLMQYIVKNGDPSFYHGLRKMSAGIKEATKQSGPCDSMLGDLTYLIIRKTAKELCHLLFDVEHKSENQHQSQSHIRAAKFSGLESSLIGKKYEGFGSPSALLQKSLGTTVVSGLQKLSDYLGESPADCQHAVLVQLQNSGGSYLPPVTSASANNKSLIENENNAHVSYCKTRPKTAVKKHKPGRAGGGWDDIDIAHQESCSLSEEGSDLSDRLEPVTSTEWTAEEQLVSSFLTSRNNSYLFITLSELQHFKKRCAGLNCEKIVDLLCDKLHFTENAIILSSEEGPFYGILMQADHDMNEDDSENESDIVFNQDSDSSKLDSNMEVDTDPPIQTNNEWNVQLETPFIVNDFNSASTGAVSRWI